MSNEIPQLARLMVKTRFLYRCCRCGVRADNGHWHHRRSRSVRDDHRHCTCNGVWLCATCHEWAHAHPFEARGTGFIVSRHEAFPGSIPIQAPWGTTWLDCNGGHHDKFQSTESEQPE